MDILFTFAASLGLAQPITNEACYFGVTEEDLLNSVLATRIGPTTIGEATAVGAGALPPTLVVPSSGSSGGAG